MKLANPYCVRAQKCHLLSRIEIPSSTNAVNKGLIPVIPITYGLSVRLNDIYICWRNTILSVITYF